MQSKYPMHHASSLATDTVHLLKESHTICILKLIKVRKMLTIALMHMVLMNIITIFLPPPKRLTTSFMSFLVTLFK